jgi:hypothetical protein
MQFVLMFDVMLILPISCFVYIATTSSEVTRHLKSKLVPRISSPRQVVPLITSICPIMFLLIIMIFIG